MKEKMLAVLKIIGVFIFSQLFMLPMMWLLGLLPETFVELLMSNRVTPLRTIGMLLMVCINFLATMLPVFLVTKLFCKTTLAEQGMTPTKYSRKHFCFGFLGGAVVTMIICGIIVIAGGYKISFVSLQTEYVFHTLIIMLTMFIGAYYEEALARGNMAYVGRKGGRFFSLVTIALLFSVMHAGIGTFSPTAFVNLALLASVFTQLTWINGDLWGAIGFHAAWNSMQAFLGFPVSGTVYGGIFNAEHILPVHSFISGGDFGLESSLITSVVISSFAITLYSLFIKPNRVIRGGTASWLQNKS